MSRQADAAASDHSVHDLTAQLGGQLAQLLRDEVALARAELFARARQAAMGSMLAATAALFGLTGWLVLVAAGIAGIATVLPVWAAALIAGVFLLLAAGLLVLLGRRRIAAAGPLALPRTADSLRRDVAAVRAQVGRH